MQTGTVKEQEGLAVDPISPSLLHCFTVIVVVVVLVVVVI
jgi:hypothetical protein